MVIIIIMIKWRNTSTALTAPNTELSVTYNSPKAANITKSSTSNAAWVLYAPLKRLIHHLTWWIGVDHAAWLLCLELSPTWFFKKTITVILINIIVIMLRFIFIWPRKLLYFYNYYYNYFMIIMLILLLKLVYITRPSGRT